MRISDWSSDVCSSDLTIRTVGLCPEARYRNGRGVGRDDGVGGQFRPKISEDAVLDILIFGGGFYHQSGVPELGGVGGQPHAIERRLEVSFGNPALGRLAAEIFLYIRLSCLRTLNREIGQRREERRVG